MTQRILTTATPVRRSARSGRTREPRWVSLGDAVSTVVDVLFGGTPFVSADLPSEVLRDQDRALSNALHRVEGQRTLLAASHRPMLY